MGVFVPFVNFLSLYITEVGDDEYRKMAMGTLFAGWGLAEILWVGIAYEVQNWKHLILFSQALPLGLAAVLFFFIYESPLFLLSRRKFNAFKELMVKIARVNKRQLSRSFLMSNFRTTMVAKSFIASRKTSRQASLDRRLSSRSNQPRLSTDQNALLVQGRYQSFNRLPPPDTS